MPLKFIKTNKLSLKLALALSLLGLSYSIVLIFVYLLVQVPQALNKLHLDLDQIMDSFKQPATQSVFDLDKESAHNVLVGLEQYSYIISATIIGDDGYELAHQDFPTTNQQQHSIIAYMFSIPNVQVHQRPLTDERFKGSASGQLILKIDQRQALDPLFDQLILLGQKDLLQHFIFILIVYLVVYQLITKRLVNITHQLQTISPKQTGNARISVAKTDDEIERLTASINQFIDSSENYLDAKNEAEKCLLELTQHLENLVYERTEDLELAKNNAERARDEAFNANQAKSVFLSNMSHELRTPLNSIIGFTRRILNNYSRDLPSRAKDGMQRVLDNGQYLLNLINDLLDIAKIEADKAVIEIQEIDLTALLKNCIDKLDPVAEVHCIKLKFNITEQLSIKGDNQKIQQIFMNLISNGIKYTEHGSVEVFLAEKNSDSITIAVKDSGIGIRESDIAKLFDPYNHIHSNLNKTVSIESTGLGLPLAKKLIELHQGAINIESKYGEGSIFKVQIPISQTPSQTLITTA